MNTECPECGRGIAPKATRCHCGWTATGDGQAARHLDADRHLCAFEYMGRRCRYPGTITESTTGGARWFCGGHFRAKDQAERMRIFHASFQYAPAPTAPERADTAEAVDQIRARARSVNTGFGASIRGLDWATKLQAKHQNGEALMPIQVSMMEAAVKMRANRAGSALDSSQGTSEACEWLRHE